MKDFIIGLAIGALGAYVAIKLSDEDNRKMLKEKMGSAADRAREEIDYGLSVGKSKALRAGVVARQGINKAKQVADKAATDVAERLSDGLAELSEKTKPAKS